MFLGECDGKSSPLFNFHFFAVGSCCASIMCSCREIALASRAASLHAFAASIFSCPRFCACIMSQTVSVRSILLLDRRHEEAVEPTRRHRLRYRARVRRVLVNLGNYLRHARAQLAERSKLVRRVSLFHRRAQRGQRFESLGSERVHARLQQLRCLARSLRVRHEHAQVSVELVFLVRRALAFRSVSLHILGLSLHHRLIWCLTGHVRLHHLCPPKFLQHLTLTD